MDASTQYRTQAVTTAGPAQLVAMLYQGALTAITVAEQALTDDPADLERANRELARAQLIVTELMFSLDRDKGGDIALNLAALYDFCSDRLVQANVTKDATLLPAVRDTLAGLADAWTTIMRQGTTTTTAAPAMVAG